MIRNHLVTPWDCVVSPLMFWEQKVIASHVLLCKRLETRNDNNFILISNNLNLYIKTKNITSSDAKASVRRIGHYIKTSFILNKINRQTWNVDQCRYSRKELCKNDAGQRATYNVYFGINGRLVFLQKHQTGKTTLTVMQHYVQLLLTYLIFMS